LSKIAPYRCKTFTRRRVELHNRLFQKDPGLTFQLGEDVYGIRLEPENACGSFQAPLTAHVRMDERIGFELCPEENLLAMMLAPIASLEDVRALPEQVRGVVLETAMEKLLDHIDQATGARSTIDHIRGAPDADPDRAGVFFSLTRQRDGRRHRGWIRTDDAGLGWLASRWGRLSDSGGRPLNHLPVNGRIQIGWTRLTMAEINSLEPCDVILTDPDGSGDDRQVRLCFDPNLVLAGSLVEPDRILIQDVITDHREIRKMAEDQNTCAGAEELPVADIPVKLVFEIGQAEVAVGELRRLQPGFTFQLDGPLDLHKPVTIRANGVALGRGEIVRIDDRLGVRLLEFNNTQSPSDA
jgi:type III secretion protein Q